MVTHDAFNRRLGQVPIRIGSDEFADAFCCWLASGPKRGAIPSLVVL